MVCLSQVIFKTTEQIDSRILFCPYRSWQYFHIWWLNLTSSPDIIHQNSKSPIDSCRYVLVYSNSCQLVMKKELQTCANWPFLIIVHTSECSNFQQTFLSAAFNLYKWIPPVKSTVASHQAQLWQEASNHVNIKTSSQYQSRASSGACQLSCLLLSTQSLSL